MPKKPACLHPPAAIPHPNPAQQPHPIFLLSLSFSLPCSLYAYGVLDEGYRWDLSVEDAIELGLRSIYHATFRDAASGGTVSGALLQIADCVV